MNMLKNDVIDTKKEVVFTSITSTKTYKVGESLLCERKSVNTYIYQFLVAVM